MKPGDRVLVGQALLAKVFPSAGTVGEVLGDGRVGVIFDTKEQPTQGRMFLPTVFFDAVDLIKEG